MGMSFIKYLIEDNKKLKESDKNLKNAVDSFTAIVANIFRTLMLNVKAKFLSSNIDILQNNVDTVDSSKVRLPDVIIEISKPLKDDLGAIFYVINITFININIYNFNILFCDTIPKLDKNKFGNYNYIFSMTSGLFCGNDNKNIFKLDLPDITEITESNITEDLEFPSFIDILVNKNLIDILNNLTKNLGKTLTNSIAENFLEKINATFEDNKDNISKIYQNSAFNIIKQYIHLLFSIKNKDTNSKINKSGKHPHELFRMKLASDTNLNDCLPSEDELKLPKIKKYLTSYTYSKLEYLINKSNLNPEISLHCINSIVSNLCNFQSLIENNTPFTFNRDASGEFNSIKINILDDDYYIVNQYKLNQNVGKKALTPKKILGNNSLNITQKQLPEIISKATSLVSDNKENLSLLLSNLSECCLNSACISTSNSNIKNINSLLQQNTKKLLSFNVTCDQSKLSNQSNLSIDYSQIYSNDINNICIDYGELLGGFALKTILAADLSFPTKSNESLYDSKLSALTNPKQELFVSSKYIDGASPSGSSLFKCFTTKKGNQLSTFAKQKIDNYMLSIANNPDELSTVNALSALSTIYTVDSGYEHHKQLIINAPGLSNYFIQQKIKNAQFVDNLLNVFINSNNVVEFLSKCQILNTESDSPITINQENFNKYCSILLPANTDKPRFKANQEKINQYTTSITTDIINHIYGCIMLPFISKSVHLINNDETFVSVLNDLMSYGYSNYVQLYLNKTNLEDEKNKIKILSFDVYSFKYSKWEFNLPGISRNNIFNSYMRIELQK